jgi:hypothetical protein
MSWPEISHAGVMTMQPQANTPQPDDRYVIELAEIALQAHTEEEEAVAALVSLDTAMTAWRRRKRPEVRPYQKPSSAEIEEYVQEQLNGGSDRPNPLADCIAAYQEHNERMRQWREAEEREMEQCGYNAALAAAHAASAHAEAAVLALAMTPSATWRGVVAKAKIAILRGEAGDLENLLRSIVRVSAEAA